jgi:hypothetical protein
MVKTHAVDLVQLAARIEGLPYSQRLRLAAAFLEQATADLDRDIAIQIAETVVQEWKAEQLFKKTP